MNFNRILRASMVAASLVTVAACAAPGGNVVSYSGARQVNEVYYGRVIDAREVVIQERNDGVGAAAGIVTGAAIGSQIGGGRDDRIVGGIVGAIAGGLIGNEIEKGVDRRRAIEYTIRLEGRGGDITVAQGRDPFIRVGEDVEVSINSRTGEARVNPRRYR